MTRTQALSRRLHGRLRAHGRRHGGGPLAHALSARTARATTYGLWLVGTQVIAYLLLMDLGIVALLPRETAYVTGRTGRSDAPELRNLVERTMTLAFAQVPIVLTAAVVALWWLPGSWQLLRVPLGVVLGRLRRDVSAADVSGGAHRPAGSGIRRPAPSSVPGPRERSLTVGLVVAGFGLPALAAGWCVTQLFAVVVVRCATGSPISRRDAAAVVVRRRFDEGLPGAIAVGCRQSDGAGAVERHRRPHHRRASRTGGGRSVRLHRQVDRRAGQSASSDPAERRAGTERTSSARRSRTHPPGDRRSGAGHTRGQWAGRMPRSGGESGVRFLVGRTRSVRRHRADAADARGDARPPFQHDERLRLVLLRSRTKAGADDAGRRPRDDRRGDCVHRVASGLPAGRSPHSPASWR